MVRSPSSSAQCRVAGERMDKPNEILSRFRDQCARLQVDYDLFCTLFMSGQKQLDLFQQVAPMFFRDLDRLLRDSLFIQFCRKSRGLRASRRSWML
jgi:hypothetical protein